FPDRPALSVRMQNGPGAGAATFRRLANAHVNMDLLLPVRISDELFFAVICVDDGGAARRALGDQVVDCPGIHDSEPCELLAGDPGLTPASTSSRCSQRRKPDSAIPSSRATRATGLSPSRANSTARRRNSSG